MVFVAVVLPAGEGPLLAVVELTGLGLLLLLIGRLTALAPPPRGLVVVALLGVALLKPTLGAPVVVVVFFVPGGLITGGGLFLEN